MTEVSASQTIKKIKTHFREASVGHADPGVPRKNLRIRRGWPPGLLNQRLCHRVQSTLANRLDSATPFCSLYPPPAALANVPVRLKI